MPPVEKTIHVDEKFVRDVAKEIGLSQLLTTDEGRSQLVTAINPIMTEVRAKFDADLAAEKKLRSTAEEAVADLLMQVEKMKRSVSHDRDTAGFHIGQDGKLHPSVSRETAAYLVESYVALRQKDFTKIAELNSRAVSQGVPSEGGVLVPTTVASEILRLIPDYSLYARLARNFPMPVSGNVDIGSLLGKMHAYWVGENTPITDSFPDFGKLTLNAKKLGAYIPVPLELIEDAVIDFGQLIADLIRECMGLEVDRVGIVGDLNAGDPFNGLLHSPNINVLVQTGAGSDSMTGANFDVAIDMQTAVPEGAETDNSYLLSPSLFNWLRKQKDGHGDYIYQKPADGAPATIWDRPYNLTRRMPAFSAASAPGARSILYGNWKQWSFYGTRHTLDIATSDAAGEAFRNVQIVTRGITRVAVASFGPAIAVLQHSA